MRFIEFCNCFIERLLLRDYSTPTVLVQDSCQETASKIKEYLSFILLCTLVALLGAAICYLYSLLKMAEVSINDLLPEVSYNALESDVK